MVRAEGTDRQSEAMTLNLGCLYGQWRLETGPMLKSFHLFLGQQASPFRLTAASFTA